MPDLHGRIICAAAAVCSDMRPGSLAASCAEIDSTFQRQHLMVDPMIGAS